MDDISLETLELLESRIRRIEYAITGGTEHTSEAPPHASSVWSRLGNLERGLQALAQKSEVVSELLQLRKRISQLYRPPVSKSYVKRTNSL